MTGVQCVVFLVLVNVLWSLARADTGMSCIFMESCILPCEFKPGAEVVIHWLNATAVNTNETVHSHYNDEDQLALQNQRFKGRTSLFKDQISRGNASLQLTGVEVQDQGRYKCYTSTNSGNKESFINLIVDAPVRKVDIQQVENKITCSSDGIYPEPKLTWSTNPPSNVTLQNTAEVQQTEQQLYNISSSMMLSDMVTDLVYSCTVSTPRNRRRASLRQLSSISGSNTDITIPCAPSNTPLTGLIWRFNHSQTILNQTGTNISYTVSEQWRQQVKGVSESGNLTLQDLSSKHEGIYTCELSNAEETYITNTFLRITEDTSNNVAKISGGVVGAIGVVLIVLIVLGVYRWKKVGKDRQTNRTERRNTQNPGSSNTDVPDPQELDPLNSGTANGGDGRNHDNAPLE